MRKGLIFKKGIIIALAAAVVTSPASYAGVYTVMAENNISVQSKEAEDNWLEAGDFSVLGDSSGYSFDEDNRILNVKSTATLTIKNTDSNKATTDRICVAYSDSSSDKANITLAGVNIDCTDTDQSAFTIEHNSEADVTVILADHTDNILIGGTENAGLQKTSARKTDEVHFNDNTLRIMCEHSDEDDHICDASCGKLTAKGYGGASGIGGLYDYAAGNISISGGNIAASADFEGAGIGNGKAATNYGMTIQITGGNIAASSQFGSGIGYGYICTWYKMNICISGGNIVATSAAKKCGEGIGGGDGKSSDHDANIKITGGSVNASSVKSQPTNEDGEKIYPLKVSNVADDVTIDDETYSSKLKDADNNMYIWLTTGEHTVNGVKANYGVSNSGKLLYAPVKDDFTYTAPIALIYDKTAKAAAVGIKDYVPYTDKTITVKYIDGEGNELTDAPVNAGTYTVKACMDEAADDHIAVEFELGSFTIKQADLDTSDIIRKREIPCKDNVHIVSDVELPDGWIWDSSCESTVIPAGQSVEAVAIYNGDDKANYTDESRKVTVQIIRSAHKDEDIDGKCDLEECGKLIKAPQTLIVYDNNNSSSKINVITNGKLQDDGVADNEDNIYQGTNWSYDSTKNQLLLKDSSIQSIECCDGDLTVLVSGENTISRQFDFSSDDGEHALDIYSDNKGSLTVGEGIREDISGSGTINLNITGAVVKASDIYCKGNLTIENSDIDCNNDGVAIEAEGNIIITNGYVKAKSDTEMDAIISSKQISVADSQIVVESGNTNAGIYILKENITNSIIKEIWQENDSTMAKTSVYGSASLKADLIIASGESIDFKNGASITNLDKLIVEDGATILIDGAEHKHNTNGDIIYIWQDDKEHTKEVACKDCPIGYVTKETEAHNYNAQGFCTDCDAYQPAVLTTDKYDIDNDDSKDKVYEIGNAGELYWFSDKVLNNNDTYGKINVVLTDDIVVNENVLKSDGTLNEGMYRDWIPIGTFYYGKNHVPFAAPYSGKFDGQNHTISGLYLKKDDDRSIGLFGCIEDGKIYNVSILDSYFSGATDVGGICGKSHLGTVVNCHNAGTINGTTGNSHLGIGGICGSTYKGIITDCDNTGVVNGDTYVGGICGDSTSPITRCYNTGNVSGVYRVAGICGNSGSGGYASDITNCSNSGDIRGSGTYIGGICGANFSGISYCNSTGAVSGSGDKIGGICGEDIDGKGDIKNCYYDSTVYAGDSIGDKYAYGDITGKYENVEGKTTEQYKSGEVAYLLQDGQTEEIWGQTVGSDIYPVLHGAKVYKNNVYSGCNDSSDVVSVSYSNEKKDVFGKHNFEDGICKYCGEKLAATVTKDDETISCVSLPEAIGYAENMPGSVVTVIEDTNAALDINNPDSDFTIDINGHKIDDINVNNGKITIIASKTGGYVKGELDIKKDSTVTIGDVKISGTIYTTGQLILNGGDIYSIILADKTIKLYFNNSDIKINEEIYLYGAYGEEIIINSEPHNVIPIVLDGISVKQGAAYAVAGDGIELKSDWFNVSSNDSIIDLSTSIEDNKLRIGALLNDKVYAELDENKNITYSGSELIPSVKVYYNRNHMPSVQLKEGSDYNVTYSDNINAGTATAIVTGIGAYSGTKNVTFTIEPKKISSPTFDGLKPEYTYTGQKVEPEFALMDGDTVIPSSEYEVSYIDNTEVGTATITITDVTGGNYDINCKTEFDIVKADPVINELPVADPIRYDPHKTLNEASISGGVVIGVSGENITGTWSWADDSIVPSVDVTDYDVIFTPDDQEHYNPVSGTVQVNVSKADVNVVDLPVASAITYGDDLAKAVISGGRVSFDGIDQVEIPGTFAWKDESIKPFVSDSDKTLYTVVFTPADSVNYNTAEAEITVNVSKAAMPNLVMSVDNTHKTVGSISLPGDWTWLDKDTETVIKAGGSVEAIAIYVGDDKENYDSTELKITIYRAACLEGKTVKYTLKGEKAPTCTKAGTGHTECSICGDVMSTNVSVQALGHTWNSGSVTKKPTYTATGVKTFTCTVCKATKTGSIAKLATTDISKKTSKITVSGIENKIYNGKVHTQKSLVVKAGAKTLRLNKDYTVTYSKNKAVGKASVIICGKNAYSGKITKTFAIVKAAKGKTYTVGKFRYTITGAKADGTGTVAISGTTYTRSDKKFVSLTIADTVVIGDVRFKITSVSANAFSRYTMLTSVVIGKNVTSIGSNAFVSCKNLKKMTIKSAKLKSVGAKAFSGTYSKITFAVPRNKAKAYKKLIKKGSPSAKAIYK